MASDRGTKADSVRGRILVEDKGRRRPFMRGIMIHSLMARGVDFEDAYRTANEVRARIGAKSPIPKAELAAAVAEILGPTPAEVLHVPPEVLITGHGTGRPFSKGILSQSLLAAAIDLGDAFEVARAIEAELRRRNTIEMSRRDLRRLAYETLADKMGRQTALRYLVWRKYQDPDRPVIILLGGAAGVGKTSLGLEVAHRLGIGRVVSTDSIRQIMRIMLSRDLAPEIHGSSYDAHTLMPAEALGNEPVITGFRGQSATVSVGVRASLDRAVAENASMIIDGVALTPGMIDLDAYADRADVIPMVVALIDEEAFRDRFAARAKGQSRRGVHRYIENLAGILKIQDHYLEAADRYDVPIVDNVSFDRSVLLIIRHVTETLRKRGDFKAADFL